MRAFVYKHAFVVVFVFILTLVMSVTTTMAQSSTPEPIKLKVLLLPFLSFAPFFIAEEEGYFAEQGLEIEFVKMDSRTVVVPLLLQGDLDVAGATVDIGLLNAMARGGMVKIVADKGYIASTGCTYLTLLARRTLVEAGELDNPAQLRGRRIAMEAKSSAGYYVEKVLNRADLTSNQVVVKELPPTIQPEALEQGTIDVVCTSEPWITRILQKGNAVVRFPAEEVVPDFQLAVIIYGSSLLHQNAVVGQRFMVAYLKAVRQYNQGKTTRNVEILAKYTGLAHTFLQEACWPEIHDNGQINIQTVLDFQEWGREQGLLDATVPEAQFWDESFIEYANRILGTPSK